MIKYQVFSGNKGNYEKDIENYSTDPAGYGILTTKLKSIM